MNQPPDNTSTSRLSRASVVTQPPAAPRPAPAVAAAAAGAPPPQAGPDIGAMLRRVFAHWHTVIVTLALGGIITLQVVRTRQPTFKSETVIFYREGIGRTVTGEHDADALKTLGTKLKETLLAQQSLHRVIDEFHLYPDIVQKAGYADAVDLMRKKTDFKSRSSDTFAISYEGPSRELAQKVTARMADLLVSAMAQRQEEETKETTEFLEIEKKRADEDLERMQRQTSAFLAVHPEFLSAGRGIGVTAGAAEKKKEARDAAAKRRAMSAANADRRARKAAEPVAPGMPAPPVVENRIAPVDPMLVAEKNRTFSELITAKKEFNEKSARYTEQHPDVRASAGRLAAAQAAYDKAKGEYEAAAAVGEVKAPPPRGAPAGNDEDPYGDEKPKAPAAAGAPSGTVAARAERPEAPRDLDQSASLEIEFERLQRQLGLAHKHDADLESKLYHAEMIASTNESGYGTTIAVLDPAYRPSGPSNLPNKTVVMVGLLASVVVGLTLSAAWGLFLDDRVFSPGEIEGIVMVPVVGVVPRAAKGGKKKGAKKARPDPSAAGGSAGPGAEDVPAARSGALLGRVRGFFRRRSA